MSSRMAPMYRGITPLLQPGAPRHGSATHTPSGVLMSERSQHGGRHSPTPPLPLPPIR